MSEVGGLRKHENTAHRKKGKKWVAPCYSCSLSPGKAARISSSLHLDKNIANLSTKQDGKAIYKRFQSQSQFGRKKTGLPKTKKKKKKKKKKSKKNKNNKKKKKKNKKNKNNKKKKKKKKN